MRAVYGGDNDSVVLVFLWDSTEEKDGLGVGWPESHYLIN